MLELQIPHSFSQSPRLIGIDMSRIPFFHCTEHAPARADIAEYHESSRATVPTLADIRASCLFTNGVERQVAH